MLREPPRNPAYTDHDPPVVLALRRATERRPEPLGRFFCLASLHLSVLVFLTFSFPVAERAPKGRNSRPIPLYIPPPVRQPRQRSVETSALTSPAAAPRLEDPTDIPPPQAKFDLSSTEISIAEDLANALPEVIRQQSGVLALVDRDDQSIARYIFEPPDWTLREAIVDVSGKIRISMSPASKWTLLRTLAERHSIDLERYQVCALFEISYARCLDREIRQRASAERGTGRVKSASLLFTVSKACGIEVLNVQYATNP